MKEIRYTAGTCQLHQHPDQWRHILIPILYFDMTLHEDKFILIEFQNSQTQLGSRIKTTVGFRPLSH
jgi:hypothetical protein